MRLSRTCGNRASMGKVDEVTAQGYAQRESAPAAAKCRTLTRRFAPASPSSRRGAGTGGAPTNPQEKASAKLGERLTNRPPEAARSGRADREPRSATEHNTGTGKPH